MKRIFYFHRDSPIVRENENRTSKDSVGISQPFVPEGSNKGENSYVSLKEYKDGSGEVQPMNEKNKDLLETQNKGEQEAESFKNAHALDVPVKTKGKKSEHHKTLQNSEAFNVANKIPVDSSVYLTNNASKNTKPVTYSAIELNQNIQMSKKDKLSKEIENVLLVGLNPNIETSEKTISDEVSETTAIENFVKNDLVNDIKVVDNLSDANVKKVEIEIADSKKDITETVDTQNVKDAAEVVQIEEVKSTVNVEEDIKENINSIALVSAVAPLEDHIKEFVGHKEVLHPKQIDTESNIAPIPEINLSDKQIEESKEPKQEKESTFENSQQLTNAHEGILLEQVLTKNSIIIDSQVSVETQQKNENVVESESGIKFFAGVNGDLHLKNQHTLSINNIMYSDQDRLQSLIAKQYDRVNTKDVAEETVVVENKLPKLKLFNNVVKKFTAQVRDDVELKDDENNFEVTAQEISMKGIRETYQRILNSYK